MTKREKVTLLIFGLTLLMWFGLYASIEIYDSGIICIPFLYGAILCSIVFVVMLIICILHGCRIKVSGYLVFGIINAIIALVLAIYCISDINSSYGLFGFLILMYIVPIPVLLIVIDVIVYFIRKNHMS